MPMSLDAQKKEFRLMLALEEIQLQALRFANKEAFDNSIKDLTKQEAELKARVADLQGEIDRKFSEHERSIADKEALVALNTAQVNELLESAKSKNQEADERMAKVVDMQAKVNADVEKLNFDKRELDEEYRIADDFNKHLDEKEERYIGLMQEVQNIKDEQTKLLHRIKDEVALSSHKLKESDDLLKENQRRQHELDILQLSIKDRENRVNELIRQLGPRWNKGV